MRGKSLGELAALGPTAPRPSTFYRSQHPELFSDSERASVPVLPRDLFVFHLEQITTEKREYEFEDFARRLAEREICPNLLPQTGPVGGGDSRTDSSTYPISQELAERRCWIGHAQPSSEEWAFAFSCKHDWRSKVKDDVGKVASLPRRFSRVYFITNQPVKDKARAEMEATLADIHKLDVRILDRTWIVEKVLTNHYEILAIDSLGLQIGQMSEQRVGPNDHARNQELNSLLGRLREPTQRITDDYALAQDYLHAAKLASSLERSRDEVDGLFSRACDLAKKAHHVGSIIRIHYTFAWRTYFWHDDAAAAERIFEEILAYLPDVGDAELLELYSNLCSVLETASLTGFYPCEPAVIENRRAALNERLGALIADQSRPNNALHAETLVNSWSIRNLKDRTAAEKIFNKLARLFRRAQGLGTYPIFHFMEVWQEFGEVYCDWPGYDKLQQEMQRITAARSGEAEAGHRQIQYGWQLLEKGHCEDALRQLSAGRFLLAKEETLYESVDAALGCAAAYHDLGHIWAARAETLRAASVALHSVEHLHQNPKRAFFIALRMSWIELELGRIAPFLAWRNLVQSILHQLEARGQDVEKYSEELRRQDGCFGCLFLKVPKNDISELRDLSSSLDRMGLSMARLALLYACGEKDLLCSELGNEFQTDPQALEQLIENWRAQPAFEQVPDTLCNERRDVCTFQISIFDVQFKVRCKNTITCVLIAESILGMLEAAFALAKWENFAFVYDSVSLYIDEADGATNPPSTDLLLRDPINEVQQIWNPNFTTWIYKNSVAFSDYLERLLKTFLIATTIDPLSDVKSELQQWYKDGVFGRALIGAQSGIALCDIVGQKRYNLNYWINETPEAATASEI